MPTLNEIILEAAKRCGAAMDGTCSSTGTVTTLIDVTATEQGVDSSFGAGGFIYRKDATAVGDRQRVITADGFNTSTGAWTVGRAWANAPASAEAYQVYASLPYQDVIGVPESWKRLANRALRANWFLDEFVVGRGMANGARRFPLMAQEVTLFAFIAVDGGSGATVTPPSGWTLVREDDNSTDLKLITYTKRAVRTDPNDWTFSLDSSRKAVAVIAAYIDCNASSPVDASGATSGSSSATASSPSVSTSNDDELVLRVFASDGVSAFTNPNNYAKRADVFGEDGNAGLGLMLMDAFVQNAGASGTATATLSTARVNIGQSVALGIRDSRRRMAFAGVRTANNGSGAGEIVLPRIPALPNDDWVPNRQHIRQAWFEQAIPSDLSSDVTRNPYRRDASKNGNGWEIIEADGLRWVEFIYPPTTGEVAVLSVQRPYPELVDDGDETGCPLDLAALRTRYEFFRTLNNTPQTKGQYAGEEQVAFGDWWSEYQQHRPPQAAVM